MILSIAAGVPKCDTLHVTRLIIAVWHRQSRSGTLQNLFRTLFRFVLRSARRKESAGKPACVSVSDLLHNRTRRLLLPVGIPTDAVILHARSYNKTWTRLLQTAANRIFCT